MDEDVSSSFHLDVEAKSDPAPLSLPYQPIDAISPDVHRALGDLKWKRFEDGKYVDVSLLDEAIKATQIAVGGKLKKCRDSGLLIDLGFRLGVGFLHSKNLVDLHRAHSALKRALKLSPNKNENRANQFFQLAMWFEERNGLDYAIVAVRCSVDLVPHLHLLEPAHYAQLGILLYERFERVGDLDDIDQSIAAHRKAIEVTPYSDPNEPACYNNLGNSFGKRFERNGALVDIEQAIVAHRRAVDLTPDGHPDKLSRYNNLGHSFRMRFKHYGDVDDIEQAIAVHHRAVDLTPDGHPDKPSRYNSLGDAFRMRFERNGDLADIEQAIAVHHRAVDLTPDDNPNKPALYTSLGSSFRTRFEGNGDLDDIEQAIAAHRRAVHLTPEDHPDKSLRYNSLGNSFLKRFERNGDLIDIEQAIAAVRRAVDLMPDGHPDKPSRYNNLGISFLKRFQCNGDLADIEQAIAALRRAVDLTPDGHPDKSSRYNSLGSSFAGRFERNGDLIDIEQAIAALRRAVDLMPDGHPDKPSRYNNLGISFTMRFQCNGDLADIEQAIAALRRAVDLMPDGHPDKPASYSNLGNSLTVLCKRDANQSNFNAAVQAYIAATAQSLGNSSNRLAAAVRCVHLHALQPAFGSWKSLLLAHSRVIDVLPEIVWLGFDINRRFSESAKLGEHVTAAVSAAIAAGSLKQAVEWLEAGRALIWSQLLSLRTPFDELREARPDLAGSLQDVQQRLQESAPASFALDVDASSDVPGMALNAGADRHRGLAIKHGKILEEIRACVGFKDFLLPKQFDALIPSLELLRGPVVFINVYSSRSDALILSPNGDTISIRLPDLSLKRAAELRRLWITHTNGGSIRARGSLSAGTRKGKMNPLRCMLRHMWNWIVWPVLKALNLAGLVKDGRLSHVTWCPTGPLMQLPLHAAGLYDSRDGPRAYKLVVSSYVPSLSALQRCSTERQELHSMLDVLIVSQPATPNHAPLPGTEYEGARLETTLKAKGITPEWLNDGAAIVKRVHTTMQHSSWVHLACHGSQDRDDLTQSAFELFDGPLTLSALMGTASENAELAFLSACQTAVGDEKTPEESAHLAAGMLAVGFKGVVATMWAIQDADVPVVVDAFYKEMFALRSAGAVRKGSTGAAYALHEAMRVLRKEVGEHNFMRWVPFVHFGV